MKFDSINQPPHADQRDDWRDTIALEFAVALYHREYMPETADQHAERMQTAYAAADAFMLARDNPPAPTMPKFEFDVLGCNDEERRAIKSLHRHAGNLTDSLPDHLWRLLDGYANAIQNDEDGIPF